MLSAELCAVMKKSLPQITFSDSIFSDFSGLYNRIVETNAAINITSILEENSVVMKHFIDSLSLFQAEEFTKSLLDSSSICDIGCGGGFPGLPLALVLRDKKLVMIDSTEKKINALKETVSQFHLNSVVPVWGRGEELASSKGGKYREKFDLCVSRAVARLSVLTELCLPFVKKGGYFIALKGKNAPEELNDAKSAVSQLGAKLVSLQKVEWDKEIFDLPMSAELRQASEDYFSADRYLVIIRKEKETPNQFPRKWAQMTKKPL